MADTQYITKEGQLWTNISYVAYGTITEIKRIIEANPKVPITPRLTAGIVLTIPIIENSVVKTDKEKLAPWKRDL